MTEDRFDRCCWWYIALLVACTLAIVGTMLLVQLLEAYHEDPEPPTETVDVETQAEADPGDPATLAALPAKEDFTAATTYTVPGYIVWESDLLEAGFVPAEYENYLGWRTKFRAGWDKLVEYGRYRKHGIGPEPPMLDPMMALASDDAYATYCCMTFVRLSGFPASPFCDEEYALYFVRTCRERGRSWEVGLAIAREESTWGTNPRSRNLFGVCDPAIDMSDPILGYCAFLDKWCGARDEMAWILYGGGYNDSQDYKRNIANLSAGIRGEAY